MKTLTLLDRLAGLDAYSLASQAPPDGPVLVIHISASAFQLPTAGSLTTVPHYEILSLGLGRGSSDKECPLTGSFGHSQLLLHSYLGSSEANRLAWILTLFDIGFAPCGTRSTRLSTWCPGCSVYEKPRSVCCCLSGAFYMQGYLNSLAELLSPDLPVLGTEWNLHSEIVCQFFQLVLSLSMDLFAMQLNHRLPRFVSLCPDPRVWRIDAFSFKWKDMVAYAFLASKLLHKILRKLQQSPVRLFLVAPC